MSKQRNGEMEKKKRLNRLVSILILHKLIQYV